MTGLKAETLSRERVLRALRHLTERLRPDDAGARWLLGQLDLLYEEITDEAAEAVRSVLAQAGARALIAELTAPPQDTQEARECAGSAEADTAPPGPLDAQAEGAAPGPRETFLGGDNRFPPGGPDGVRDRVLAILATGPSHTRALAAQLHRRIALVLAALHGLERAGRIVRSRKAGRGTRWALEPHGNGHPMDDCVPLRSQHVPAEGVSGGS